jgi:hypothetical protein
MTRQMKVTHEFVDYIPDALKEGTVYVCVPFATAVHKCCCGCGNEVVTPLSPTDWKLIFDGQSISLDPSVGNWSFPCQSHYWIRRNKVVWARRWSQKEIEVGRAHDRLAKKSYFDSTEAPIASDRETSVDRSGESKPAESFWRKLKRWWS